MRRFASAVCVAALIPLLRAELPTGTWVRRPNKDDLGATMIVEAAGRGRKLTFKVALPGGGTSTMIVTTQGDGKDEPVSIDGKPSPETMAIRFVDDRHMINIIKLSGTTMVTQKSEVSADGRLIKVVSSADAPGQQNGVEYWDKK